jgi:mannose-6-phosphate isomerase-like protein (cupin superfamily)
MVNVAKNQTDTVQKVIYKDKIFAVIIRGNYSKEGVEFFTPNDFSQQLAFMKHQKGKEIDAHTHNVISREVSYTKEVLVIRKGKLRVDFYDDDKKYIESYVVNAGDIILLAFGGHGFKCLEEVEMIEIKQGPYLGENDKNRFLSVDDEDVILND